MRCLAVVLLACLAPAGARAEPPTVGVAYQTWNKPLGVWQSPEQLDYDLDEMQRLGVRSLRVEWVWGEIEKKPGELDFSLPDRLVQAAKRRGMVIYPLIGFQWPPGWVGPEHRLGYMPRAAGQRAFEASPLVNYADPWVRDRSARFIEAVARRYRGDPTIAAWLLGNEFSYLEYDTSRQLGWDALTFDAFRRFLRERYRGQLASLQAAWKNGVGSFAEVGWDHVRIERDGDTTRAPVRDFLAFRQKTMAEFIAAGCRAAAAGDPRAARTYSSVGVLFSQFDASVTSEDWGAIADACRAARAPLSFFSLNSYPNLNSRLSFDLGLSLEIARGATGLDVILTEFGVTSTEEYLNIAEEKQGPYLAAMIRQLIFDGARRAHVFTWNDKTFVSRRERGFGVVREKREPKPSLAALRRMLEDLRGVDVDKLQRELRSPPARVALVLPESSVQWNSWVNECWMVASQLRRLGLGVGYLSTQQLRRAGAPAGIQGLVLCRQNDLALDTLAALKERVLPRGVHVLATSGAPGILHRHEDAARYDALTRQIFGLTFDARHALEEPRAHPAWFAVGNDTAVAGAWAAHPPSEVSDSGSPGARHDVGRMLLGRSRDARPVTLPFAFNRAAASGAQAGYVPVALGYVFPGGREPPYHHIANALAQVIETWRLPKWRPVRVPATTEVLSHRVAPLAGGGILVYAEHLPRLERDTQLTCPPREESQLVDTGGREPLVDLTTGASWPVDAEGRVRVSLRGCESLLLVSSSRRADFTAKRAPPVAATTDDAGRRRAFPARVYYENLGDAAPCLPELLHQLGYVSATPGPQHSADYHVWEAEPVRGYYATGVRTLEHWSQLFGVVALDWAGRLADAEVNTLRAWLPGGERRAFLSVATPAEAAALRSRIGGETSRLHVGTCDQLGAELRTALEK
jgi:hypothetical protein